MRYKNYLSVKKAIKEYKKKTKLNPFKHGKENQIQPRTSAPRDGELFYQEQGSNSCSR